MKTKTDIWHELTKHKQSLEKVQMRDLFAKDTDRFDTFSLAAADFFLDYSKNLITTETMQLLNELTVQTDLKARIEAMFNGEIINTTEQRPVLHTALRSGDNPKVQAELDKMFAFAAKIKKSDITDVVNIGIGGSDLGPAMVVEALTPYVVHNMNFHFVSNVDGAHIAETLRKLNPQTTLFIIVSKTFTTQETLCNARTAKEWLLKNDIEANEHLVAVTANVKKASQFGIVDTNIFTFWDWVGGRFSLWSAVGLSIVLAVGADNFTKLLAGARAMDQHFRDTPFTQNMPVILALIGIWNSNFWGAKTQAILPYSQYLHLLPSYLQQLEMESNGKRVTLDGIEVDYTTAPVIWGAAGTNGQHAFHQLLMQGTQMIPADFILPLKSHNPIGEHHMLLVANCLAQSQALMQGRTENQPPYKIIPGNNPSNTILLSQITPETLGALIALYEHKVFVQGVIWNINSFDQWGVELGKQLAKNIMPILEHKKSPKNLDASTRGLIKHFTE